MKNAAKLLVNRFPKVMKSLKALPTREVLVGVPREETVRDPDPEQKQPMTNATLAYIHDNGSPAANIPARPFMIPGMENASEKVTAQLKAGAKKAVSGEGTPEANFHKAGLIAQASIRAAINEGIPPPLSDSTLRQRIRNRTSIKGAKQELENRAKGLPPSTQDAKPLIATAQLRNSINYVIRKRRNATT